MHNPNRSPDSIGAGAEELIQEANRVKKAGQEKKSDIEGRRLYGKISRDKIQRTEKEEDLGELAKWQMDAEREIQEWESQIAAKEESRVGIEQNLINPLVPEDAKAIYRLAEERLNEEVRELAANIEKNKNIPFEKFVTERKEFIDRTDKDAAEIIGYDEKTKVIKHHFEQQREYLAEPERFDAKLELLADEIVRANIKEMDEDIKTVEGYARKLKENIPLVGTTRYLATNREERLHKEIADKMQNDPEAIKLRADHGPVSSEVGTFRKNLKDKIEHDEKQFEQDLFANQLLLDSLSAKIADKITLAMPNYDRYGKETQGLIENSLRDARNGIGIYMPGSRDKTHDLKKELNIEQPDIIASLPGEQLAEIRRAAADPNADFNELASNLGLSYSEKASAKIAEQALAENAEFDRQVRIGQLEKRIDSVQKEIDKIDIYNEIYDFAEGYQKLEDAYNNAQQNSQYIKDVTPRLEQLRKDLAQVEAVTNVFGNVKDKKSQASFKEDIQKVETDIQGYEAEIQNYAKEFGLKDFDGLKKKFEEEKNKLIDVLVEYHPQYRSLGPDDKIGRPKPPSEERDAISHDESNFIYGYMKDRKRDKEYDDKKKLEFAGNIKQAREELEKLK